MVPRLQSLQCFRQLGHEVIVVDGNSSDNTVALAAGLADCISSSIATRSSQMNVGARLASGHVLVFLHVDTRLPTNAASQLEKFASNPALNWGWFDLQLSNPSIVFRIIASAMNIRARLTSVCTGDQTLFVRSALFNQLGGFPELPLMEDIAMSKLLRRHSRPHCISDKVQSSSRRWEERGIVKTVVLMWSLRLQYFFGRSPDVLVKKYYPDRES